MVVVYEANSTVHSKTRTSVQLGLLLGQSGDVGGGGGGMEVS